MLLSDYEATMQTVDETSEGLDFAPFALQLWTVDQSINNDQAQFEVTVAQGWCGWL